MIEWVVGLVVISVRDVSPTIGVYVCALRVWVRARARVLQIRCKAEAAQPCPLGRRICFERA